MHNTDFEQISDEELLSMSSMGSEAAEEELLRRYKNFVRRKVRAYFLVGADSDDIVQEGMIGLYKAIRDYDPKKNDNFKAFAELCITRQVITAVKASNRNKHTPLNSYVSLNRPVFENESDATLFDVITQKTASDPEELVIDAEAVSEIKSKAKGVLSKFEFEVFEQFLKGDSYTEIAERTGRQPKSIDNALQRIKKKISAVLA